ncbi:hypothetical protein ACWTU6_29985 [Mesorhizobium sp. BHbsci]
MVRGLVQEEDFRFHNLLTLLDLLKGRGLTVVAALHDLNSAAVFCDRIAVMNGGRLMPTGPPDRILTADLLRDVFKVEACVEQDHVGVCIVRFARPRHHSFPPNTEPNP